MDGMSVTSIWMAGVVGMMLVFGLIALVGIQLDQTRKDAEKGSSDSVSVEND